MKRNLYLVIAAVAFLLILLLLALDTNAATCTPQTWQTRETIHRGLVIWLNRRDRQEREP